MQNLLNIWPNMSSEEIGSYTSPSSSSQFLRFSATSSKLETIKEGEIKDIFLKARFIRFKCLKLTDRSSAWSRLKKLFTSSSLRGFKFFLVLADIAKPPIGALLLLISILLIIKMFFLKIHTQIQIYQIQFKSHLQVIQV